MDINWTSLLTGVAGGIIPAAVAYYMGKRNVEASLAINKAKIDADKESLDIKHKKEIEKLCYEERRKTCFSLLTSLSKLNLYKGTLDLNETTSIYTQISFLCNSEYTKYAYRLIYMLVHDETLKKSFTEYNILSKERPEINEFHDKLDAYMKFYNAFIVVTQKMLDGEELLPFQEWNLDDFEGSVPVDYRPNLP